MVDASFVVSRTHGQDLSVTMGNNLLPSLEACVLELVANSYDADATQVTVTYKPDKGSLTIGDNGCGMGPEGLESFFRMGDSLKKSNPISEGGRVVIGKFGIASLALRMISRDYTLDSWREGTQYTASEKFSEGDRDDKPISIFSKAGSEEVHGVKIAMRNLRFRPDSGQFSVERLRAMLANELPIEPGSFDLTLNGQLVTPTGLRNVVEYFIETKLPGIGGVNGSLFYSKKTLPPGQRGVFTKVNGRAVGGQNEDLFGASSAMGMAKKLYGVVNVDGLESKIRFDRSGFLDCPEVTRLHEYLREVMKQVRRDMDGDSRDRQVEKAQRVFLETLPTVGRELATLAGVENPSQNPFEFVFSARKAGDLVYVDRDAKTVYVNPHSSALLMSGIQPKEVRAALARIGEYAAVSLIADINGQEDYEDHVLRVSRALYGDRRSKGKTLSSIIPREKQHKRFDPTLRTNANRLYHLRELPTRTGLSNVELKRLISSGVLSERKLGEALLVTGRAYQTKNTGGFLNRGSSWGKAKVLGRDVTNVIKLLDGRLTLYAALREMDPPEKYAKNDAMQAAFFQQAEYSSARLLDRMEAESALPEGIENLAGAEQPSCYVISPGAVGGFLRILFPERFKGQVVITDRKVAYLPSKESLAYAFRVDQTEVTGLRSSLEEELSKVGDFGGSGISFSRREAYLVDFEGPVVTGIVVGIEQTDLKHLLRRSFQRETVPKKTMDRLTSGLTNRRSRSFPLTETRLDSKPNYRALLTAFYG